MPELTNINQRSLPMIQVAIYHGKCQSGEDFKSQKNKKDQTQSSSNWTLLPRGLVNSDYNWVTSALYKFSKSPLALGGTVYCPT